MMFALQRLCKLAPPPMPTPGTVSYDEYADPRRGAVPDARLDVDLPRAGAAAERRSPAPASNRSHDSSSRGTPWSTRPSRKKSSRFSAWMTIRPASTTSRMGRPSDLYMGYYNSQRQGDTIHSPMNCLPGAGWSRSDEGRKTITNADGNGRDIVVNRYVVRKGLDRQSFSIGTMAAAASSPANIGASFPDQRCGALESHRRSARPRHRADSCRRRRRWRRGRKACGRIRPRAVSGSPAYLPD